MNILFLANRATKNSQASTVEDYIKSIESFSKYNIYSINMLHNFPKFLNLSNFDAVLIHYSLSIGPMIEHYLGNHLIKKIKDFKGVKAILIQDEYRNIKTYWKHINDLNINLIFSCVPECEIQKVYPKDKIKAKIVNVLTGYVPNNLLNKSTPLIADRPIDISYRTRVMPFWLGKLAYEKWDICKKFQKVIQNENIVSNLSYKEEDRLYGDDWINLIVNSKAVLGVESGASIIDYDGSIEKNVDKYMDKNPNETFENVHKKFLSKYENSLYLNQISPRIFEAIALKTALVLYEGNYSGVIKPNIHFIPLKKDFSNIENVITKIRDHKYLQAMAERAYVDVALNEKYSYRSFVKIIDYHIAEVYKQKKINIVKPLNRLKLFLIISFSFNYSLTRPISLLMQRIFLGNSFFRRYLFFIWNRLPLFMRIRLRPLVKIISK